MWVVTEVAVHPPARAARRWRAAFFSLLAVVVVAGGVFVGVSVNEAHKRHDREVAQECEARYAIDSQAFWLCLESN